MAMTVTGSGGDVQELQLGPVAPGGALVQPAPGGAGALGPAVGGDAPAGQADGFNMQALSDVIQELKEMSRQSGKSKKDRKSKHKKREGQEEQEEEEKASQFQQSDKLELKVPVKQVQQQWNRIESVGASAMGPQRKRKAGRLRGSSCSGRPEVQAERRAAGLCDKASGGIVRPFSGLDLRTAFQREE